MSYQEDLILSIYGRGEPGLAMADPLPKGPDRDKPVQAPGKDGTPSSPYLPGKSPMPSKGLASTPQDGRTPTRPFYNRPYDKPDLFIKDKQMIQDSKDRFKGLTGIDLANLADGQPDASIMNYVTENGFFLDGQGNAYMQTGGKLYDAGGYNPDIHGLPVPLAQQMKINPMMAHAGPGQFYTEEGEVTDVSPYTFNRNTTELEVPWLKEQYEQNLPQYKNTHMKIYHGG